MSSAPHYSTGHPSSRGHVRHVLAQPPAQSLLRVRLRTSPGAGPSAHHGLPPSRARPCTPVAALHSTYPLMERREQQRQASQNRSSSSLLSPPSSPDANAHSNARSSNSRSSNSSSSSSWTSSSASSSSSAPRALPAGSHTWLAAAVRSAVLTCASVAPSQGRVPFLQLVHGGGAAPSLVPGAAPRPLPPRFQAIPISTSVADDPQSWSTFSSYVRSTGASGLVLVRPIPSPEAHCAYGTASAAAAAAPAVAAATPPPSSSRLALPAAGQSHACGPAGCSRSGSIDLAGDELTGAAATAASVGEMLAGQVGECCGGGGRTSGEDTDVEAGAGLQAEADMDAGSDSSSSSDEEYEGYRRSRAARGKHHKHHEHHSHKGHGKHGRGAGAGGACDVASTAYWGLVVQGNTASEADGCYVLKTSQSGGGAGGCSCTHFSLTRVCVGAPLYTQLRDAWLVAQQHGQGQQAAAAGAR